MAIAPLVKATFAGPASELDAALDGLQREGCMHLNDLGSAGTARGEPELLNRESRDALQYLRDCPVRRRAVDAVDSIDFEAVTREALEVRDRSRALAEERDQLKVFIAETEPYGDFELPEWARDGRLRFWFYALPLYRLDELPDIEQPWKIVARDHRFAYVTVIGGDTAPEMPVAPASLDPRSLSALKARLAAVEREIEALEYRRIGLTIHTDALAAALDEADDRAARRTAGTLAASRDGLFAIEGWAPAGRRERLEAYAAKHGLAASFRAPRADESPPTLLDNPEAMRGGESLITFYTTPSYGAWDPSIPVLFIFAAFFAMILADAGYGLLLAGVAAAFWNRLGGSASGRSMRALLVIVVVFSILYGVISASYFGVTPPEGSWLAELRLVDANDQTFMMWLSIVIGALHITSANLISAWMRRRSLAALGSLGWALIVAGGATFGLGRSYAAFAPLGQAAQAAMLIGAILVLLFSSTRPLSFAPLALLLRLVDGLKGATQITKAFGDVLSYLRLFALGLAAFKLAEVFNGLAASAFEISGVGLLLGVLILVVGHGLNFVMGIMSGVVHSLRLNLIEFFSWSLTDEGRPFRAFVTKANRDE